MSLSLILAACWAVAANVAAMIPSRDDHWSRAYALIVLGIPVLGMVVWQHGPWVGLLILGAAMSMLRWPVIYLARWLRRRLSGAGSSSSAAANPEPGE
ncbi:DUF2484 family protein [Pseudooceanicola aestuarii]|uniref:DUF2484 family protein n=1 Tax=Pseudooceanicola aestuarii TaxID=2697319 RepID=UPI0013D04FB6|nr:DUF2484 family protein [Pseudooceanicola aestuarii]